MLFQLSVMLIRMLIIEQLNVLEYVLEDLLLIQTQGIVLQSVLKIGMEMAMSVFKIA